MKKKKETTPTPLRRPPGVDRQWREKVERAKEARKEGQESRRGKAPAFDNRRSRLLEQQGR